MEYEVEKILNRRVKPGTSLTRRFEYFVQWKGYGDKDRTWEPAEHMQSVPKKIEEYEKLALPDVEYVVQLSDRNDDEDSDDTDSEDADYSEGCDGESEPLVSVMPTAKKGPGRPRGKRRAHAQKAKKRVRRRRRPRPKRRPRRLLRSTRRVQLAMKRTLCQPAKGARRQQMK